MDALCHQPFGLMRQPSGCCVRLLGLGTAKAFVAFLAFLGWRISAAPTHCLDTLLGGRATTLGAMAAASWEQPKRSFLRDLFLPVIPRSFPWARPLQLVLRSLHLAAMALVVGGLPFGADFHQLRRAILLTVATGLLLFVIDLAKDAAFLVQGSGVALLLKLGLLGMGLLQPAARLPWYLAATLVASIGSHMPGTWRHFSLITWKVMRTHD